MTVSRRSLLVSAIVLIAPCGARAVASVPFDEAAFATAQAAGRPILVAISAPWCPICKAQKPILAKLATQDRFRDLAIFDIDFDTQKPVLRRFGARMQSTLIAFKGEKEVGRSVGETQAEWIEAFVEKAL